MRSENYMTTILGGGGVILGTSAQDLITFGLGAVLIIVSIISNINANKKHKEEKRKATAERELAEAQLRKINEKI